MPTTTNTQEPFKIGLCMAGAISAGAYTAGVMDYLLEALDNWEAMKKSGAPNVPKHTVEIPVIGGASAGGMTGIITAAALSDKIPPVQLSTLDPKNIRKEQPQNIFYHSWVDLIADDMFPLLLQTSDIDYAKPSKIVSALNAEFIEKVANRALQAKQNPQQKRSYFSKNLKVFSTITSLNGLQYNVAFKSNNPENDKYLINRHDDYGCFVMNNEGNQYKNDGWIPLDFYSNLNIDLAKQAAMATGAFPVGLKARPFTRNKNFIDDLSWLKDVTDFFPVQNDPHTTTNIDGGLINNEPFEKVRELLNVASGEKGKSYQKYDIFKSTVLMIDPFPSESNPFNPDDAIGNVIGNTLSSMIDHLRVKPATLIDALDSDKAGQFLISPTRTIVIHGVPKKVHASKAIACGTLGGFGGFLHKEFRIHDYFLGRANCEKFLRDYFTVPLDTNNPIFVEGYQGIDSTQFRSLEDNSLQIIPIFTKRQPSMPMPIFSCGLNWPIRTERDIDVFDKPLRKRVEAILFNLTEYSTLEKGLLWAGAKILLNGKLSGVALNTIKKSLRDNSLLE